MKAKLLAWASKNKMNEIDLMNFLQDRGLVADNAVTLDECCERDLGLCAFYSLSNFRDQQEMGL